jgi:hypothetical protein
MRWPDTCFPSSGDWQNRSGVLPWPSSQGSRRRSPWNRWMPNSAAWACVGYSPPSSEETWSSGPSRVMCPSRTSPGTGWGFRTHPPPSHRRRWSVAVWCWSRVWPSTRTGGGWGGAGASTTGPCWPCGRREGWLRRWPWGWMCSGWSGFHGAGGCADGRALYPGGRHRVVPGGGADPVLTRGSPRRRPPGACSPDPSSIRYDGGSE